jgi:glycine dehydrogenase
MPTPLASLEDRSQFQARHIGPDGVDETLMCAAIGVASRQALMDAVVPAGIRRAAAMQLPAPVGEAEGLAELRAIAAKNRVLKSFIGQGYSDTHTPGVILRNILENPAWYTAYTPYQAEISQGRMEAILNFQTLVCDLTGMAIANGSMLDEATAAAEAVTLAKRSVKSKSNVLIVAGDCHPQTIEVIQTRCQPLGLKVKVGMAPQLMAEHDDYFAVVCQYPSTTGLIHDLKAHVDAAHAKQAAFIVCADLLALTLLVPPGEFGADIVVGNSQRLGMPMGCGGPHAAYLACRDEYKRSMPGRLVGVSKDAQGAPAYRLALQTREQHIRREKATSNICTAQVLPAVVASMYAVYHGPQGLKRIAERVASYTAILSAGLQQLGLKVVTPYAFDTLTSRPRGRRRAGARAGRRRQPAPTLAHPPRRGARRNQHARRRRGAVVLVQPRQRSGRERLRSRRHREPDPAHLRRSSAFLTHPVFNTHHSETEMLRYIRSLSDKDLALDRSMIPLGSCTMKLNATTEMIPSPGRSSRACTPSPRRPAGRLRRARTRNCAAGCARPPATPASACSPMPGRRASTPVCWPSAPGTPAVASRSATSA